MIEFRNKSVEKDLMPEVIKYLKESKLPYNVIAPEDADRVSSVNSKAIVLVSCKKSERGYYRVQVQDKELYRWTQKFISESCGLRIVDINKKDRVITAECDHFGRLEDFIYLLSNRYNLSVVDK